MTTYEKTKFIANISYADGTNRITRRVWADSSARLWVKIEGMWRELEWYTCSDQYQVRTLYAPSK